jgi:two-component system, cell cycle response regulator
MARNGDRPVAAEQIRVDDGTPVVLVATPDAATRRVVRDQLTALSCHTVAPDDPVDILECCQATHPDAVLIDLSLVEDSGAVLLEGLRADPTLADTTVVLLGDDVDPVVVAAGLRIGAHDYLRTPIDTAELIARVASALRVKALRDELRAQAARPAPVAPAVSASAVARSVDDDLRGVSNFTAGRKAMLDMVAAGVSQRVAVAAVMIDIDDLQNINLVHGWEAGDAAMMEVARRVITNTRERDIVMRWGRDELLVVMAGLSLAEVAKIAESLVHAVRAEPVVTADGPIAVSVTAGCASVTSGNTDELLLDVEAALCAAKQEGWGRVALPPPAKDRPVKSGRADAMAAAAAAGGAGGGRRRGRRGR